ncbi:MAG TPA: tetratricopeptide repeat protein, partial [Ignavibacteriaceae bacterium]|nr:tetratricopeptide repeat protein [Ignavibacteriaceae bacterium]
FNDKVTLDLERIEFKAMAKDKEERYQHVDDMMADLRRERKNLEYARAGYAKSSTITQPVNTGTKSTDQSQQIKTSGKTFPLKTVIGLSFVIILVIAFLIFNPFKVQVTQNSAVAKENNSLAVMYFQNIPDPADKNHTGDMLTNLLITSLSQVKGLDVISRDRLLEIEKDLGQTNTKELSPSLSIKIAKQAGVTTMLTGSILQMSPKLAVTTNLVNVQTGKVIGSQQLTNFSQSQIFNLVDSLSFLIQNALQVSSSSTEKVKSVADVTTKSPEAYRAYVEGLNLNEKLFWKEANSAYERAVNLDPNFAMAYYQLAGTQYTLGQKEAGLKSFQKAVDLAGNATKRERLLILAANYEVQNNPRKAIEAYSQLIKLYPHSISAYISIFNIYSRELFDAQKGNAILREGVKVNPNAKNIWNLLAYSYAYLGNKHDALDAVNKYISLAPAEPNPYDTKGDIYAWFMDYDSSRAAYEYSTSLRNDFDAYKIGSYDLLNQSYNDAERNFQMSGYSIGLSLAGGITTRIPLPLVEIEKGQIKNAKNKLIEILKSKLSPGEKEFVLYQLIHLCYESSQYSQMLKYAKEVSSELHKDPTDEIYGRDYIAWALVKNGKLSEADNLVNEIKKDVKNTYSSLQLQADYISALVIFEEGKYTAALEQFSKVVNKLPPNHEPNIFYAISLLKNGQIPAAENELNRLVYWPSTNDLYLVGFIPGEVTFWPIQSVKARYWLGVAYEQLGKKEKAITEYKKFLNIWKDADFNSSEIKDAKVKLAKLERIK